MSVLTGRARQIYVDLVRARSRVRVVDAREIGSLEEPPIFVLGIYRSGTTLLRYVLDSHPRIACPPESNFLQHFEALLEDPEAEYGLRSMGFDGDLVVRELRRFCVHLFGNYAASQGKPRWADKTPRYVDHLDLVDRLFPEACYVAIHRHPLDQIHSFTRGGAFWHPALTRFRPDLADPLIAAAHYWAEKTERVLAFCASAQRAHALQYEALCRAPEDVLRPMFTFIGEAWNDRVLRFATIPHDQGAEAAKAGRFSGFELQTGGFREWPHERRAACADIVRTAATRLGYEVDPA